MMMALWMRFICPSSVMDLVWQRSVSLPLAEHLGVTVSSDLWANCVSWISSVITSIGLRHVRKQAAVCIFSLQLCFLLCLWTEVGIEQAALHRQQSLPHRPMIPLVARMADQNTSGTPAMTEREASRLDKFRQVLAGPNTDLGKKLVYGSVTWFLKNF